MNDCDVPGCAIDHETEDAHAPEPPEECNCDQAIALKAEVGDLRKRLARVYEVARDEFGRALNGD